MMSCSDLKHLQELIGESGGSEKDYETDKRAQTPSANASTEPFQAVPKSGEQHRKEALSIWSQKESVELDDPLAGEESIDDGRIEPDYEILYKQVVSAEDMFIGMSEMNPSSASCNEMSIRVVLPNTRLADTSLDVRRHRMLVRTPQFKLFLHLPHPVESDKGKATWTDGVLNVILPIIKDF